MSDDPRWGAVRAGIRYDHEPSLQDTALAALASLQTEHELALEALAGYVECERQQLKSLALDPWNVRYREALEEIASDTHVWDIDGWAQRLARTVLSPEGTE